MDDMSDDNDMCYVKQYAGCYNLLMPDGTPVPYVTDIMIEQDTDQAQSNVASVSLRLLVEVKE